MAHAGGRPLKFQSVEELDSKVSDYFTLCDEGKKPYTLSGLALYLDVDRETILNYTARPEYSSTLKKAKQRCEEYIEQGMMGNKINPASAIFILKNNYGYKDSKELDLSNKDGSMSPVANMSREQLNELMKKSQLSTGEEKQV